jgi:hypothetical protein
MADDPMRCPNCSKPLSRAEGNCPSCGAALPATQGELTRRDYGRRGSSGAAADERDGRWWRRPESIIGFLALIFLTVGVVAALVDRGSSGGAAVASDTTATRSTVPAETTAQTATSTPPPRPQPDTGTSGDGPSSAPGATAARRRTVASITRMIRTHWTLRADGDAASLSRAYGLYTGALRADSSEFDWIAGIRRDGDMSMTIQRIEVGPVRAGSAPAVVRLTTRSTVSGCKRWIMRYTVVREDGRWLMSELTADPRAC